MEIKRMKLRDLRPADYHPRKDQKPGDANFEAIKKSIDEFGHVQPIIWNRRTGNIVGGHQRWTILLSMGVEEDEVSVIDLPLEKEKLLNVALNKIGSSPDLWDLPRLKDLIIEFETLDMDVQLTGFDKIEIEKLLSRDIVEDGFDAEAEATKIITPVTRPGDIYQLGRHRLMCGDSTSRDAIHILMDGCKADMVFTDPPYNVNYGATMKDAVKYHNSKNAGRKILNDHFENKDDGTPLVRVESCAIDSDIWEFKKPTISKEHPTMKPIGLVARALRNSSKPGDMVLDSFGGSGTTMMAAEQTGREARLMELDPKYCDVIVKRWELFTGEKAQLIN